MALGNARSWVRSKDNNGRTDINATQLSWYGGYRVPENPFYVNYSLSYAYNEYGGSREIYVGPADNRVARANYHSNLYGVMVEAGYAVAMEKAVVTPLLSVCYNRLQVAEYRETGAGDLSLNVAAQDYERVRLAPGIRVEASYEAGWGTITPEIHARFLWDPVSERQQILSSFAGGGTAFSTEGYEPAKEGVNVGTSVTLAAKGNTTVSVQYDLETREDYYSHTGRLNVSFMF